MSIKTAELRLRCNAMSADINGKAHLKKHETYISEAAERNPTVEILGN